MIGMAMEKIVAFGPILLGGMGVTLAVALLSMALATVVGVVLAVFAVQGGAVARGLVTVYTTVARGVPDLVLMLLLFFGGERAINGVLVAFGYERIKQQEKLTSVVRRGDKSIWSQV